MLDKTKYYQHPSNMHSFTATDSGASTWHGHPIDHCSGQLMKEIQDKRNKASHYNVLCAYFK